MRESRSQSSGNKLPFGLKGNQLVDVSEVPQGLACDCVCPACHAPLQARKGEQTVHHFAHDPKTRPADCQSGYETALHMMAKQIIEEHAQLILPELLLEEFMMNPNGGEMREQAFVTKEMDFTYDSVHKEQRLGSYQPDVIVSDGDQQLLVEVAVTHFVEQEKKQAIRKDKHMAIEIDLSDIGRFPDKQDLVDVVITATHNKRWLSHPDVPRIKGELRSKLMLRKYNQPRTYGNGMREMFAARHVANVRSRRDKEPLSKMSLTPRGQDYLDYDINPYTGQKISKHVFPEPVPEKKTVACKHCRHVFEVNISSTPRTCPLCLDDL